MSGANTTIEQLAAYRSKKLRHDNLNKCKTRFSDLYYNITNSLKNYLSCSPGGHRLNSPDKRLNESDATIQDDRNQMSNCDTSSGVYSSTLPLLDNFSLVDWIVIGLKLILWLVSWKISIAFEWGAVYFLLSGFTFIWFNLKDDPKKNGELSAYSVFNPNCEQINGTFTAEQFEKQLLNKM